MEVKEFKALHDQYEQLKASMKPYRTSVESNCNWESSMTKALLLDMIFKIRELLKVTGKNSEHYFRLLAMEGALQYQHAKVLVESNETEKAREILECTIDSLKNNFCAAEITFLGLRVLNHYCYLLTKCGDFEKSREMLQLAEVLYSKVKSSSDGKGFYSNDDLFRAQIKLKPNKEVEEKLERLVTNNLQMLAFVYSKLGKMDKFAAYHHEVLRRQLEMREGDATVWAMKTARLGYYFITRHNFLLARHYLAAACYVLSQYENTLKTLETTDLVLSKWKELNHRYADIAKCWVKYGLFLFHASRLKSISTLCEDSSFANTLETGPESAVGRGGSPGDGGNEPRTRDARDSFCGRAKSPGGPCSAGGAEDEKPLNILNVVFRSKSPSMISIGVLQSGPIGEVSAAGGDNSNESEPEKVPEQEGEPKFFNLDLSCFESCVSCSYVDNLESARDLFLFTHSWLKKSKLFYTLKDHPMEYVNVVLDLNELYGYLAFYEEDVENQYSVQKRRADTLEGLSAVIKDLRSQCYIAVSIELLWELAEVHLELVDLNLRRLYLSHSSAEPVNQENRSTYQRVTNLAEETLRKMKALVDMHLRLSDFGRNLGDETPGNFVPGDAPGK